MTLKNILENKMNQGVNEQMRLIDTLKRLLSGEYSSEREQSIANKVKQYLDLQFKGVKTVPTSEKQTYVFDPQGKPIMIYYSDPGSLFVSPRKSLDIMELFDIDEDFFEVILKEWLRENLNLHVKYVDYDLIKSQRERDGR